MSVGACHNCDAHCDRDGDRDAKTISVHGAAAMGGNALSESSMCAVAVLVACYWSGLDLAGGLGLLESGAGLLLLLISESVLLSLVGSGAGGGGHLPLTKKF